MLNQSRLLFILLFFFKCIQVSGQVDTTGQGFISYENQSGTGEKSKKYKSKSIKSGVFNLFSGKYGLVYERELNRRYSIEVGGGVTGRNFVGNMLSKMYLDFGGASEQNSPNFNESYDVEDDDFSFDSRDAKLGWYFTLMPRMYFQGSGFDGGYLALNLQYRNYNFEAYQVDPFSVSMDEPDYDPTLPKIDEFENNLILALAIGNQALNGGVIIDWFLSAGVNIVKAERRDNGWANVPIPYNSYGTTGALPRQVSTLRPYFEIGFQIGGWWE